MIVLWAMMLWAAAIILAGTGYGARDLKRYALDRRTVVLWGLFVWVLGWFTLSSLWPGARINLGFPVLAGLGVVMGVTMGSARWWFMATLLGMLGAMIRLLAPIAAHHASVMPVAAVESVGLGVASGLSIGESLPAATVAVMAEALAALVVAWHHAGVRDLGRHDLAMTLLAALSAWAVGWVADWTWARLGRTA